MRTFAGVIVLLLTVCAAPARAGSELSIRLVEASEGARGGSLGGHLSKMLPANLPFKQYDLLDSQSLALPASGSVTLKGGFMVTCSGGQQNLSVSLFRNNELLLTTLLNLQDDKPVVLGGFPGARGKVMIVLEAR